jgi:carbonic anhydrase/acetyltransferase-like protein (isoleucine patch superfamily)
MTHDLEGRDEPAPIAPSAFIHPTAVVYGDVWMGAQSSVWPTAVIRGDVERITIGARSNVQDGAVIHADPGMPTVIGADCVVGHRAIVHGSTLEDGVLVGMGAILLNGVHVERGSVIAAGAVLTEGMRVPAGSLVVGVPGRVVRSLDSERQAAIVHNAARYVALARAYRDGLVPRRG